jgi:predicted small metal-binding protein
MANQYSCSACGFQVQADDEQEVIDHVQKHADEAHDMDVSSADIRSGMEEVNIAN